jgi:hypothetical protein
VTSPPVCIVPATHTHFDSTGAVVQIGGETLEWTASNDPLPDFPQSDAALLMWLTK